MMNMAPLLEVENLRVHFPIKRGLLSRTVGRVFAVDGVSFDLAEGETLGLVGESGCGKTTTGLGVLGMIEATGGSITYKGEAITRTTPKKRRHLCKEMQMIFQDPYSSLNPRLTVEQILADPMQIHGLYPGKARADRVAFLLEKVGLSPDYGKRFPHEFSGGQRQRVGIARALTLNPRLIVGDEPVSALDVSIQAQIINLLIDLQEEFGLSYILIAHDLAVVEHLCDRVAVMYLGRVVESGTYKDVYGAPKHPYTQALLSAVPVPEPKQRKQRMILQGDVPSPIDPPSGCHFHPRCPRRMDHCHTAIPTLREVAPGHAVRCFLYE
jgi:oligopeptide/dipeptide ABC transporter ATP-binding protein